MHKFSIWWYFQYAIWWNHLFTNVYIRGGAIYWNIENYILHKRVTKKIEKWKNYINGWKDFKSYHLFCFTQVLLISLVHSNFVNSWTFLGGGRVQMHNFEFIWNLKICSCCNDQKRISKIEQEPNFNWFNCWCPW